MLYNLNVDEEQVRVIANALVELPYKIAYPVLYGLQTQINEQNAADQSKALAEKAEADRLDEAASKQVHEIPAEPDA